MIVQGVAAVALAVFSLLAIACHSPTLGFSCFAFAVVFILTSLFSSMMEIITGTKALDEELALHAQKQSSTDF
jgi:drug/metabolite transporter superfamily protein YnfA